MVEFNIYPRKKEYENFLKLYPIEKANKFLPDWYKKTKLGKEELGNKNAKNCPAIQDVVSNGYIIPLWSAFKFETIIDKNKNEITQNWYMSATDYNNGNSIDNWIGIHGENQTIDMDYGKLVNKQTLKLHSPYIFDVPKGYSMYFNDPFYHFRKDIRCLSGIVEVDKWGEVAFPFEILKDNFYIKAGTPLIHIYLFKKEDKKINLKNNNFNEDFNKVHQLRRDELVVSRKDYRELKN